MAILSKKAFLMVLFILSVNFWDLAVVKMFLSDDIIFLITVGWLSVGIFWYSAIKSQKLLLDLNFFRFAILCFALIISSLSAMLFHDQDMLTTLVAQRWMYTILAFPLFFLMRPSIGVLWDVINKIAVGTIFVWGLSLLFPNFIERSQEARDMFEYMRSIGATELTFMVKGTPFVLLFFYHILGKIIMTKNPFDYVGLVVGLSFFILAQNRSYLLGVIPFLFYTLSKGGTKSRMILLLLFFICLGLFLNGAYLGFDSLISETMTDLGNADYNRLKALKFFIFDYSPNIFCFIFGNGFPSALSSFGQQMWKNFEVGIYASDLGLIGMWSDYGIPLLLVVYSFLFQCLRCQSSSISLKLLSLHILFVPTIFHFWRNPGVLFFCCVFYLIAEEILNAKSRAMDGIR